MNKLFALLFHKEQTYTRAAISQTEEELSGEIHQTELVASYAPVEWKPLDLSKLPKYNVRNQDGSSSCVAFSMALIASIMYFMLTGQWVDFSAAWFYHRRDNRPGEGMNATNSGDIFEAGALPEVLMPSDNKGEADMNNPKAFAWFKEIAKVFGLDTKQVIMTAGDIDVIASTIQATGKPVNVWYLFGPGEWAKVPKIVGTKTPYAHSVVAIPPSKPGEMTYGLYEGKKAIVIQDSWGNDLGTINGLRIITEDFHASRNFFARYWRRFKFEAGAGDRPSYLPGNVVSLQDCLRYEGVFPATQESTGNFGVLTRQGVRDFQSKYSIQVTGTVGPITIAKLKELYP